jgi:hypothetical protein
MIGTGAALFVNPCSRDSLIGGPALARSSWLRLTNSDRHATVKQIKAPDK